MQVVISLLFAFLDKPGSCWSISLILAGAWDLNLGSLCLKVLSLRFQLSDVCEFVMEYVRQATPMSVGRIHNGLKVDGEVRACDLLCNDEHLVFESFSMLLSLSCKLISDLRLG